MRLRNGGEEQSKQPAKARPVEVPRRVSAKRRGEGCEGVVTASRTARSGRLCQRQSSSTVLHGAGEASPVIFILSMAAALKNKIKKMMHVKGDGGSWTSLMGHLTLMGPIEKK